MGVARGIFMVDSHVIPQSGGSVYPGADPESMLLYHMDKYGIDVTVLKSHGGYYAQAGQDKNALIQGMVKRHPDRFVALCCDVETQRKEAAGEEAWSMEAAVKELDEALATGLFAGIGEGFPRDRNVRKKMVGWDQRLEEICMVMDLCRKYKKPLHYITGWSIGSASWRNDITRNITHPENFENATPILAIELAAWYPDVPIILSHGGVEGSAYHTHLYEQCLYVAAAHRNVFLDCGQWWTELYERPLRDVNIGPEKILFGTGWGQPNLSQQWTPGMVPETFTAPDLTSPIKGSYGGPPHTINIWGWSLSQLGRLNIPQDDLDLIMGGNAVHLFNIKTPQPAEMLFRKVDRDYLRSEVPPARFPKD